MQLSMFSSEEPHANHSRSPGSERDWMTLAATWPSSIWDWLTTGGGKPGQGHATIATPWAVRRLTPRECERLQGFPDDYTLIPYRRGMSADGPRYKALGNSMAVNVMEWIGQRIEIIRGLK